MKKLLFAGMIVLLLTVANTASAIAVDPNGNPVSLSQSAGSSISLSACSTLTTNGLAGVVSCFISILNSIVVLLIAGAVVYTIYGAFEMIRSEEKREAGKEIVMYGIIGLFVMVSVWGLVNILTSTFGLTSGPISPPALTR